MKVYSVYDEKALAFGVPFFAPTDGIAVRLFADLSNDTQSNVSRHPGDYKLYYIGEFSEIDAKLTPSSVPMHLANALDFVAAGKKDAQ